MANIVLEMQGITKEFPGVKALDNVTFSAYEGEILAIMGENGAGKSTLMKVLSGSYDRDSYTGRVLLNGVETHFESPLDSENAGISMIYQEISVHLDLSVAENVFMGQRVDFKKMYAATKSVLKLVNLDIDPKVRMRALNISQMQLVTIARALSKAPKILVLDEPTSALTESESDQLFSILHSLKKRGITSILISHKIDEVFANADRVTVMRDGKVISTNDTANVDHEQIIKDMVGRSFESFYPDHEYKPQPVYFRVEHFTVMHQ